MSSPSMSPLPKNPFTLTGEDRWEIVGLIDRPAHIFRNVETGETTARIIGSAWHAEFKPAPDPRTFDEAFALMKRGRAQRRRAWKSTKRGMLVAIVGTGGDLYELRWALTGAQGGPQEGYAFAVEDLTATDWEDA